MAIVIVIVGWAGIPLLGWAGLGSRDGRRHVSHYCTRLGWASWAGLGWAKAKATATPKATAKVEAKV